MKSNRDELLRRKRWAIAAEVLVLGCAIAVPVIGLQLQVPVNIKLVFMGLGLILYLGGLMLLPPGLARCPACNYNLTRFSLRKRKTLQINFCAHCGLELDAPLGDGKPESGRA